MPRKKTVEYKPVFDDHLAVFYRDGAERIPTRPVAVLPYLFIYFFALPCLFKNYNKDVSIYYGVEKEVLTALSVEEECVRV